MEKPENRLDSSYNQYRIKYLVDNGYSISQIAEMVEVSRDSIKRHINKYGVKTPFDTIDGESGRRNHKSQWAHLDNRK